ncbi:TetR/AcrR family transcriptional regulator [uncultured Anaerococcus sp.]|uniref:TetR/AcrR family transcriptional regulator n=1 Tax=uncultured Anaerococcus sp. TaxID=293428 RepID=UPI0035A70423
MHGYFTKIIPKRVKKLVFKEGHKILSIRKLAKNFGLAIDTIYKYFSSKDDLSLERVWEDIFRIDN